MLHICVRLFICSFNELFSVHLVQDHDGSHIKGLLINFIHSFWPTLLKVPSFLVEFITPIVKVNINSSLYNILVLANEC